MSELKITVQQWFTLNDAMPIRTTCLFSDGVSFWSGWWDGDNKRVRINANGNASVLLAREKIKYWTQLENLIAKFEPADETSHEG